MNDSGDVAAVDVTEYDSKTTKTEVVGFATTYDPDHLYEKAARETMFGDLTVTEWYTETYGYRSTVE